VHGSSRRYLAIPVVRGRPRMTNLLWLTGSPSSHILIRTPTIIETPLPIAPVIALTVGGIEWGYKFFAPARRLQRN
jgi:hypothetical protein